MRRSILAAFSCLLIILAPLPGSAAPSASRLYLLGSDTGFNYWSVDASDPELNVDRVERSCDPSNFRGMPGSQPCGLLFLPGSRMGGPIQWNSVDPIAFRLALDIEAPGTFTVHLSVSTQQSYFESPAATQTSPGVWEGELTTAGSISPTWMVLGVRIKATPDVYSASLRTGTDSYVDLPHAVSLTGVPQLLRESPAATLPTELKTDHRTFTFNDDRWTLSSFEGDMSSERAFDVQVPQNAEFVIAWVELFRTPFLHDVLRGRDPDAYKLVDSVQARLLRGDQYIAYGDNPGRNGLGTESVVAMDVAAGPLTLQVTPWKNATRDELHSDRPYRAYVLAVHGARTLASMRWPAMPSNYPVVGSTVAPLVSSCPLAPSESVPVSDEVTTWHLDMDVDSVNPLDPDWTLAFLIRPSAWFLCGELSNGDELRFTYPFTGVALVGPTLASGRPSSEWRDTLFQFTARFAYTPEP